MYCTNCGQILESDAKFCTKCGSKLENNSTNSTIVTHESATVSNADYHEKYYEKKVYVGMLVYRSFCTTIKYNEKANGYIYVEHNNSKWWNHYTAEEKMKRTDLERITTTKKYDTWGMGLCVIAVLWTILSLMLHYWFIAIVWAFLVYIKFCRSTGQIVRLHGLQEIIEIRVATESQSKEIMHFLQNDR